MEVILTLFAMKCLYPQHVHLARGNHESKSMNSIYGFNGEVRPRFRSMVSPFSHGVVAEAKLLRMVCR